jgi:hypothetical protein
MQIPDTRVSELWTPSARSFKATAGSRPPVRAPSCSDVWLLKPALPVRFVPNGSVIGQPGMFDRVFRFVGGNSTEPPVMPQREGPVFGKLAFEISSMANTTTTGSRILVCSIPNSLDGPSGHSNSRSPVSGTGPGLAAGEGP